MIFDINNILFFIGDGQFNIPFFLGSVCFLHKTPNLTVHLFNLPNLVIITPNYLVIDQIDWKPTRAKNQAYAEVF